MYLRTISRRNRDGSVVGVSQQAHNTWDSTRQQARAEVVYSFGREDELDREALKRLVRSISRFLDPADALEASASGELSFVASRPFGGAYVLDELWRKLEIPRAIAKAASGRRLSASVERLLFCLVCNRALAPSSKLAALEWAASDVALPGISGVGSDPQVFYRAMDFLLDATEAIQREVFFSVANLFNLEVDVILFDTTSTYFEIDDTDDFRRFGHSKDHRGDRPQVVIGLAVTKDGIPVARVRQLLGTQDANEGVDQGRREGPGGRVVPRPALQSVGGAAERSRARRAVAARAARGHSGSRAGAAWSRCAGRRVLRVLRTHRDACARARVGRCDTCRPLPARSRGPT